LIPITDASQGLEKFLEEGRDREIEIAQISQALANHLGASTRKLILHHAYALKAFEKHRTPPEQFPMIFETVDRGVPIADRPRHITFLHCDEFEWNSWFQVTIKMAGDNRRLYLCTFYKQKGAEVRRKLKKYPVIKK
jgi:hypothetical protein